MKIYIRNLLSLIFLSACYTNLANAAAQQKDLCAQLPENHGTEIFGLPLKITGYVSESNKSCALGLINRVLDYDLDGNPDYPTKRIKKLISEGYILYLAAALPAEGSETIEDGSFAYSQSGERYRNTQIDLSKSDWQQTLVHMLAKDIVLHGTYIFDELDAKVRFLSSYQRDTEDTESITQEQNPANISGLQNKVLIPDELASFHEELKSLKLNVEEEPLRKRAAFIFFANAMAGETFSSGIDLTKEIDQFIYITELIGTLTLVLLDRTGLLLEDRFEFNQNWRKHKPTLEELPTLKGIVDRLESNE
ncbi:hypothetical protein EOPP23_02270 [Endozoicomonas sp. OPT23]|uniref:hypothetical protein n=1 Tax=Endozoicomonas sp. OPT23 TaxID=2072845 RepID=UPI00129B9D7D|nr:hypothetical protein [Endozoicomonas sp. OPT23]MRI31820.1 hypothetical protein [Endozoicomonas sp. OPT23]